MDGSIRGDAAADAAQQQGAAAQHGAVHHAPPRAATDTRQSGPQSDEEDELDRLTAAYEAQAAAEASAAASSRAAAARRAAPRPAALRTAEALATPLPPDNKGFMLLTKMGFQGQGLGRERQGRAEPVPLMLKSGRAGLGVEESAAKRKRDADQRAAEQASKRQANAERAQQGFKGAQADAYALRQLRRHIAAAEAAARSLDERSGVENNPLLPHPTAAVDTEPDPANAHAPDGEDIPRDRNPAGDWEGDEEGDRGAAGCCGASGSSAAGAAASAAVAAAPPPINELTPGEAHARLAALVDYLRSTYAFCVFCGVYYSGQQDMAEHCPGPGEDDH